MGNGANFGELSNTKVEITSAGATTAAAIRIVRMLKHTQSIPSLPLFLLVFAVYEFEFFYAPKTRVPPPNNTKKGDVKTNTMIDYKLTNKSSANSENESNCKCVFSACANRIPGLKKPVIVDWPA